MYNEHTLNKTDNKNYFANIHIVQKPITIFCDDGSMTTNQKRMCSKFEVWYNPKIKANILSLKTVTDYNVTHHSNDSMDICYIYSKHQG